MPKVFQAGPVYTYQQLKFYAMNGFIALHDERDGQDADRFIVLTRREFLERAQALGEERDRLATMSAENSSQKSLMELRKQYQDQVEQMLACCQDAKEQGDHTDPKVSAWFQTHRPWARSRNKSDTSLNFELGRPANNLPRGRRTGRTTEPGVRPGQVAGYQPRPKKLILPEGLL